MQRFILTLILFSICSVSAENYSEIEKRVLEGLKSSDWEIRLYSASILGQIKCKAAISEIKSRLFKESHRLVMAEYCKTLGMIGDSKGVEVLLKVLNADKKDILRNDVPLEQMGRKQRVIAEEKIKKEKAEYERLYGNAIWALGRLKAKKSVKTLCSWAVVGKSKYVRNTAVQALIEIRDFEAIVLLSRALGKAGKGNISQEEAKYRKNAFAALIQLLPKFKQSQAGVGTTKGGSRITNTTLQNANFIYSQLFRLPKGFGRLISVIPSGADTYLWFESEEGIFRVKLDSEGNFDINALKIGRYSETPSTEK